MTTGRKRWLLGGVGLSALLAVVFLVLDRDPDRDPHGQSGGAGAGGSWRGFQVGPEGTSGAPSAGPGAPGLAGGGTAAASASPLDPSAAMADWRRAILDRNADTVLTLDRAFLEQPARFTPALTASAQSDANERVRAFSTRVLGKLRNAELVPVFSGLLTDTSPYVRQNAAWALGELGGESGGRQAARKVIAELRRLEQRDTATDVRAAANGALRRLQ